MNKEIIGLTPSISDNIKTLGIKQDKNANNAFTTEEMASALIRPYHISSHQREGVKLKIKTYLDKFLTGKKDMPSNGVDLLNDLDFPCSNSKHKVRYANSMYLLLTAKNGENMASILQGVQDSIAQRAEHIVSDSTYTGQYVKMFSTRS